MTDGRQLDHIDASFAGDARVIVVIGFKRDALMTAFPDVTFVYNERYAETNTARRPAEGTAQLVLRWRTLVQPA